MSDVDVGAGVEIRGSSSAAQMLFSARQQVITGMDSPTGPVSC